jgi:hypothetical protein
LARKKILPKKLGPLKIPKTLRRAGNKALADPQTVKILSAALVSMGAAVAARKIVEKVPGGAALARSVARSATLGSVADVVRQALEDALQARHPAPLVEPGQPAKSKGRKHTPETEASASDADEGASADQRH